MSDSKSKIVQKITCLFGYLRYISIHYLIIKCKERFNSKRGLEGIKYDNFTDHYVFWSSILAIIIFLFIPRYTNQGNPGFFIGYCLYKSFELIIYQMNIVLFDEYRYKKPKKVAGHRRLLVLLFLNYVELSFLFAMIYKIYAPSLSGNMYRNWIKALNFSVVTISSFGTTDSLKEEWLIILSMYESILGFFLSIFSISYFVSLITPRGSRDKIEKKIIRKRRKK